MEFDTLQIKNFKSISRETVDFKPGIIVVHGQNGAGKTSFLEAAFFALYGSDALPSHSTLEDVIKKGEDELEVTLEFFHDDEKYRVSRSLRRRGDGSPAHSCQFKGGGTVAETITGAKEEVESLLRMDATSFLNCAYVRQGEIKLVEASPSDREEMIDRLLQLGDLESYRERANKIRLGAKNARENREALLDDVESEIEELEAQELQTELDRIEAEIAELEEEHDELESDLDTAESDREAAQDRIDDLEETQQRIEELEEKVAEIEGNLQDDRTKRSDRREELQSHRESRDRHTERVENALAEVDGVDAALEDLDRGEDVEPGDKFDREPVKRAIEKAEQRREEITDEAMEKQSQRQSLEGEAEQHRSDARHCENTAEDKQDDIAQLRSEADKKEDERDEIKDEIGQLEGEMTSKKEQFDDAPTEFGEASEWKAEIEAELEDVDADIRDVEKKLATARDAVETAENLLDEGKCPECGQSVEGSPHVEGVGQQRARVEELEGELQSIEERRADLEEQAELADNLVGAEEQVADIEDEIDRLGGEADELEAEVESLREEADELEAEVESLREEADELREKAGEKEQQAEEVAEEIDALESERDEVEARIDACEAVDDALDDLVAAEKEISHAEEKLSSLNTVIEEREGRLDEATEELESLRESFDEEEMGKARKNRREADERAAEIMDEINDINDRLNECRAERGRVSEKLDNLEAKREKRASLEADVERLLSAEKQAEDVRAMYGTLREELREKNVAKLEQLFNEVFMDLYQSDTYERIELTNDYEITIHDKEQGELAPQMLSGGEKVMFNLALRCAIYQLLAEASSAEEASAPPTLPPLILDEPTAHLDDTHVTQLTEIVDLMRDLGVGQTVVVSHDEEVVASSDVTFRVDLNSSTNSSTIERKHAGSLSL